MKLNPAYHARRAGPVGFLLGALFFGLLAFAIASAGANPVNEASDHVAEPVGRAVGILAGTCPDGWSDESVRDEHARAKTCKRGDWLVSLRDDGSFDHAWQDNTAGATFIEDPTKVPGWK